MSALLETVRAAYDAADKAADALDAAAQSAEAPQSAGLTLDAENVRGARNIIWAVLAPLEDADGAS